MGIDPSPTNTGVFVVDVNIAEPAPFVMVYGNTLFGEKVLYDVPVQFDDTASTGVSARGFCLARSLGTLIEIYQPDVGICEDNYLGVSAGTFKQLIQFVGLVRESFNNNGVHLSYVLPNLAKAIVGANFKGSQKEDVRAGLLKYPLLDANGFDLSLLDEHSVDAGAVTLYRCEQIAKNYGVYHG
jgi:Holliday junction resolvasome RuvABC endonuclease subunit